jgi:glycosyltransferase involved in cell wall biosynthesis
MNLNADKANIYTYKASLIIPVYNEEENVELLQAEIEKSLNGKISYEVVYVDDGSKDASYEILEKIAQGRDYVKVIKLRRNYGQTAAMQAGIENSSGEILIPLDSDLQNDPSDIPELINKIEEGYDVVSGWRKNRQDTFINRKLPSVIANSIISWISGVKLHDYGCSLKAYKADVLQYVKLYGELHRFIPVCASWYGAKVTEMPVKHHARRFGKSKYGINRTIKVILDLIVIKFLTNYATRPIYVFGGISVVSMLFFIGASIWALILKFNEGIDLDSTPLPVIAAMFFTVSVQIAMMGLLADMLMRTYYESQDKKIYTVEKRLNFNQAQYASL